MFNSRAFEPFIRTAALLGTAGPSLFAMGTVVAGTKYPGYSHVDQMISELGGADATRPWIQNLNFIVFGSVVMLVAAALMLNARKVFAAALLLAMLGFFGTFMEGVLHCDSGCQGATTAGAAHLASGLFGFISGVLALFLFARRWRNDPRWANHVRFTRWSAWAAALGLVVFAASDGFPSIDGLAQRLFVLPLLAWITVTSWRLRQVAFEPGSASHPALPARSSPHP